MTDEGPEPLVDAVHAHLKATATLPLSARANGLLGEAQAVAADAKAADSRDVVRTRASQLRRLLAAVEGTGHPEADDHVDAALTLLDRLERALDERADGDAA